MTTPTRIERRLPDILADLSAAPTPEYLDDVFVRTGRMRQRPAWTFPERWLPMDIATRAAPATRMPWRQLGVLALIAVLLAVALAAYVGSQRHVPPPFGPARNGLIPYSSNGDIYLGDPLTGQSRVVVAGAENDWGPSYSPDGTQIGFIRSQDPEHNDIYVVRPDGTDLRRITSSPLPNAMWAQWAPDSRHIAVIRPADAASCADSACVSQLALIDASNGSVQTIMKAAGLSYVQFRPPDGREFLYRALVDGKWGLFAMDADGKNSHPVVPPTVPGRMDATFANATYSPDGNRIFFDEYTEDASFGSPGCCRLFVVNADGSGLHKFLVNTGDGTWDGSASVSPDGNLVAFWHNLPNQSTQKVTVIRADGTGQPIETGPPLSGGAHWIWAPDSSAILMYPNDVPSGRAYLLDPAGGPWKFVPWTSTAELDWQRLAP